MPFEYPFTGLATVGALMHYQYRGFVVGQMRYKCKVEAPKTSGPEEFEIAYRTQMNELENLAIFLPALWLTANVRDDKSAGVLGGLWILGRVLFATGYAKDKKSRGTGFMISFATQNLMVLTGLYYLGKTVYNKYK